MKIKFPFSGLWVFTLFFLVVLGILWVPLIRSISSQLFIYLQSVQAYISPPIAAVFLIGVLWKRVNGKGAIYALITGAFIGALRLVLEILNNLYSLNLSRFQWFVEMNFLHFAIFLFVISSSVLVFVSLLTSLPPTNKIDGLTFATADKIQTDFTRKMEIKDPKWNKINIVFSIILALTILILWGIFF